MIYVIFYSENKENIPNLRDKVDACCRDTDCTYLSFEYPMDVLDFLNTSRPANAAVYFETVNLSLGLEIGEKVGEINHRYRFNLLCPEHGVVEELFYRGVSYFIAAPYHENSLIRSAVSFKNFFNDQRGKTVTLKSGRGTDVLNLEEIDYVMSDKRRIIVYSGSKEESYYYRLDEVSEIFGESFLRCHQSYSVNMKKIKQFIEDGLLLTDDTFIPVSRNRYYASKREYLDYITGSRVQ